MGCCAAKPEPAMRKKKSTRFKSLKTAKSMTKFPGKNRSECESEADIKSNVSSVFDKYDFKREGYLGEKEIRFMIMEMASTRKEDITMKDIDRYVQKFMQRVKPDIDGKISKAQFYHFYRNKEK